MMIRTAYWMATVALSGGLALACDSTSQTEPKPSFSEVREESGEAVDSMAAYAAGQRAEIEARAERAIDNLANEIDAAQSALTALPVDAKQQTRESLEAAIDRAEEAQKTAADQVEASQQATQEQWTTTKSRLSDAMDEVSEARREIAAALRGETATSS